MADALSQPSTVPEPVPVPFPGPTASSLVSPSPYTLPPPVLSEPVLSSYNFRSFSPLQLSCPSIPKMKSSLTLSLVFVPLGASSLLCEVSSGSLCPLLPLDLNRELFKLLHGSSHPGIRAFWRLLSAWFVWPGLSRDVGLYAHACLQCWWTQTHVHASVPAIPVPSRRFSHVHLDLALFPPAMVSCICSP